MKLRNITLQKDRKDQSQALRTLHRYDTSENERLVSDKSVLNVPQQTNSINQFSLVKRNHPFDNYNTLEQNIICQKKNQGSYCMLSQSFGHSYDHTDGHYNLQFYFNKSNIIQFEATKQDQIDLYVPRDIHNIPAELYIDRFIVAGQGTIGLKFQAKERFQIVLNCNTKQSCGKTNVIVLDVGEDTTCFRKCNNDNSSDILASTDERKALLDKNIVQLYWFSLDKKNRRLRYGKGPMQSFLTVFCYDFPPKPSQGIDEYAWIENLHYVAISSTSFQKKDFIESRPRIELSFCSFPVTVDLPPVVIRHEDATLDELETGKVTVIDNLPDECKELYWNVIGDKVSLKSSDFPDFADAIEYSINTPGLACYEKLKEKASTFGNPNPKKTYMRITLGEDRGNSPGVPYVLEIWPSGHYSPIHSHSDSFAIIKVLHNEIVSRYFTELQPHNKDWYYEVSLKEGQVTWISDKFYQTHQLWNRTRKMCATIQCYRYGNRDHGHYEFFDYIDNNIVKQFRPNADWTFTEFKKVIRKEWNKHKYLSTELKNS